uniref:Uncharacterized protein n=1 Tax=Moniliophthora roreri TaxID=221103 RepID=A0A0W0FM13_MONRR
MADTLVIAQQVPLPAYTPTSEFQLEQEQPTRVNESSLPPVDEGLGAWSFEKLLAVFLIEVLMLGLPNSFGVFLDAYLKDPAYSGQRNPTVLLPLIGPLSSGIIYCTVH